ncbi:DUF4811 domain-containing protein [Weissella sagaensis]|uniref:DUF4811 domain-containing protein n=1 Tax=Weissella sagaensis TaxID=2559928 RepID=UPI00214AB016|nr:DUF4811 domain-containing protein [Weissella sagaensis]
MILWVITILIILTIISLLLINNKIIRYTLGTIFMALLIGAIGLLSANMYNHYGMEKVTIEQHTPVYSAGSADIPVGMLITKKIENQHYIMIYKDFETQKEPTVHFEPNKDNMIDSLKKTSVYKKTNVDQAQLVTKTTRWRYKSSVMSKLFKFKDDNTLVKVVNTVQVPNNWQIIEK